MKKIIVYTALFTLTCGVGAVSAVQQLTVEEQMGRHVYMDKGLSLNRTQSCQTCHHRTAGFADPTNSRDPYNTMVSLGDDGISKGGRNAPTSAYCGFSPTLYKVEGEYFGGTRSLRLPDFERKTSFCTRLGREWLLFMIRAESGNDLFCRDLEDLPEFLKAFQ